ncbi:MAG: alpha/beta fold hydrolase [Proteobacteria bacterium]|nr:alpha/beta fold hydrolase [Pseudomonadota bacterium]MBU1687899.1 alpha/beta fold hydrolase [Pseudomonadota bacterium]
MDRRLMVLFGVVFGVFTVIVPAQAGDLVLGVDRSVAMGRMCGNGSTTLMELARERISEILADPRMVTEEDRLGLLGFAERAEVVVPLGGSVTTINESLAGMAFGGQVGNLREALVAAAAVIEQGGHPWESRIIILSGSGNARPMIKPLILKQLEPPGEELPASENDPQLMALAENKTDALTIALRGGNNPEREILAELARLSAKGIMVHLILLDGADPEQCLLTDRYNNDLIQIERIGCGSVSASPLDGSGESVETHARLAEVRTMVIGETGLPSSQVNSATDFYRDLGLDHQGVFDLLALICEKMNIAIPDDPGINTVGQLADYADTAPLAGNVLSFTPAAGTAEAAVAQPDGAKGTKEKESVYEQEVFYATNRQATGLSDPDEYYGGDRARDGLISYGRCLVTIPANHRHGATESAFLGLKFLEDAEKHIILREVTPIPGKAFFSQLQERVHQKAKEQGWSDDSVVFVHGFNVKFAAAAKRTAQIAYDFGFTGLPLMFSWPSDGKLYAYMSDREDASWSVLHIEQFLEDVLDKIGPKRVHLVAHSMGNQGLIGALNMMAARRGKQGKPLFENVILAAPDFDAGLFREQVAANVVGLARSWTIYTSDNDAALNFSTSLNSAKRLGLPVTPLAGIAVIDATGVEVTPWSVPEFHSYYATKQRVVEDIVSAIKGVAPSLRKLQPMQANGLTYWRLQPGM